MREIWLKTNRRAMLLACILPVLVAAIGIGLVAARDASRVQQRVGAALVVAGAGLVGLIAYQLRQPRIAFNDGFILFYLRRGSPIKVPVEIVESFFAGQSPAHLPGLRKQPQSVNLIARLSQRHKEWAEQTVKLALGQWRDGYVTIRGTWCEPLDADVIRRLNRRLKEVKDAAISGDNDD